METSGGAVRATRASRPAAYVSRRRLRCGAAASLTGWAAHHSTAHQTPPSILLTKPLVSPSPPFPPPPPPPQLDGRLSGKMDHLVCFLPGMLALAHENGLRPAESSLATYTRLGLKQCVLLVVHVTTRPAGAEIRTPRSADNFAAGKRASSRFARRAQRSAADDKSPVSRNPHPARPQQLPRPCEGPRLHVPAVLQPNGDAAGAGDRLLQRRGDKRGGDRCRVRGRAHQAVRRPLPAEARGGGVVVRALPGDGR